MAQKEPLSERAEKSVLPNLLSPEFAAMGKKRIEEVVNAQTELFEELRESNRQWLDRAQSEVTLASEFASKLTAVRSLPDAMTACQEWNSRHFEMMAEDGKHLLADAQKVMETGARLLSNGWWTTGKGGGST
jgi:hypothetical protein